MPFLRFPDAPIPIAAVWNGTFRTVTVEFDRDLQPGAIDPANWTLVHAGGSVSPSSAEAGAGDGSQVVLQLGSPFDLVSIAYDPPPFDVVALDDVPAEAFSDFPVS